MIRVKFDPAKLTGAKLAWWQAWEARADAATRAVIADWETWLQDPTREPGATFKPTLDATIWKDLRDWLLDNVFNEKCAYCETPVVRATFHGEHFRPKGRVQFRDLDQKKLKRGLTRQDWHPDAPSRLSDVDHPGYFWLAYNWKNLLPSCEFCNTAAGKKDQFPVGAQFVGIKRLTQAEIATLKEKIIQSPTWPDLYYLQPDDLDALEDRYLVHPYFDDPTEHFVFDDSGMVAAKPESVKGAHSIKVCDLAGEELVYARFEAQMNAVTHYYAAMAATRGPVKERYAAADKALNDYLKGKAPYTAAARAAVAYARQNGALRALRG
jgi:hypothetical protein